MAYTPSNSKVFRAKPVSLSKKLAAEFSNIKTEEARRQMIVALPDHTAGETEKTAILKPFSAVTLEKIELTVDTTVAEDLTNSERIDIMSSGSDDMNVIASYWTTPGLEAGSFTDMGTLDSTYKEIDADETVVLGYYGTPSGSGKNLTGLSTLMTYSID